MVTPKGIDRCLCEQALERFHIREEQPFELVHLDVRKDEPVAGFSDAVRDHPKKIIDRLGVEAANTKTLDAGVTRVAVEANTGT
ncbi:hypothetical protein [Candidatus Palauibacter sp.]|uniref:hypothetical protein n=1 Tax=Candidatus Palauibacter sp. TaxID=3101350 RepID=UPI003AF29FA4